MELNSQPNNTPIKGISIFISCSIFSLSFTVFFLILVLTNEAMGFGGLRELHCRTATKVKAGAKPPKTTSTRQLHIGGCYALGVSVVLVCSSVGKPKVERKNVLTFMFASAKRFFLFRFSKSRPPPSFPFP
jgi:hypothetical protein